MKYALSFNVLVVLSLSLFNAACKKSDSGPSITYTTLKVLETKTNLPVAGARVEIYECKKHSFGGCSELSLIRTFITDNDGNFQFDSKWNVHSVDASESRYWPSGTGGEDIWGNELPVTNINLTPVAYTKIHLKKINPHSPGSFLVVRLALESSPVYNSSINAFDRPADTTVLMPGYGNSNNTVSWYFTDALGNVDSTEGGGQLPNYYINRFDTASVEINY